MIIPPIVGVPCLSLCKALRVEQYSRAFISTIFLLFNFLIKKGVKNTASKKAVTAEKALLKVIYWITLKPENKFTSVFKNLRNNLIPPLYKYK